MTFKATFSGFPTKAMAQRFIDWFEGGGEQDEAIEVYCGASVLADVKAGIVELDDGFDCPVKVYEAQDE